MRVISNQQVPHQTVGAPSDCHASMHAASTVYEGKKTSMPSGTIRATLMIASPSSSLYSAVSRDRNDAFSVPPDGPVASVLTQTLPCDGKL